MKVLVTGSCGFIGNYVIKELIKRNDFSIIATDINTKKAKNFEWFKDVRFIECNLNNKKENFFAFFENPDYLIHLAWEGLPNYNEIYHFERNYITNYHFIKNMVINGISDVSAIGTCLEYGLKEGCLSENLIANPITPYGLAKDTLRKSLEILTNKINFNFKWIRLFYIFGKGQNPKSLLPQLEKAIEDNIKVFNMSGGEQLRDYLSVEKVAEYIVKISLQNKINGIINCCSGNPISIRKLVENYLKERGKNIKLNLGYYDYPNYEPMAFWGDNKKLKLIIKDYK